MRVDLQAAWLLLPICPKALAVLHVAGDLGSNFLRNFVRQLVFGQQPMARRLLTDVEVGQPCTNKINK